MSRKPKQKSTKKKKNSGKSRAKSQSVISSREKLYTTGDLINITGLGRQTLHTYRQMGLIEPVKKSDKGRWFYDVSVFAQIKRILRWHRHRALTEVVKINQKFKTDAKAKAKGVLINEDEKPKIDDPLHPPKFYTIGEVIQITGFTRQVLHNYIVQGLLKEAGRTPKGHRLFDESVFARIKVIQRLKEHRTIDEVKKLLDEKYGDET